MNFRGLLTLFCFWAFVAFAYGQIFIPASTSALVQAGGEVEVRLGVTEQRGGQPVASGRELDFVVVGGARAGDVVEVRQLPRAGAKDAAILRYRHRGGRDVARDVIRYLVVDKQSGAEVTSGTVLIEVAISRLEVEGADRVDFGNVALGSTAEAVVVVRNSGTETAVGRVVVEEPFLVGGGERYVVPPGGTVRIVLGFRPQKTGRAEAVMRFSDNPEAEVRVSGNGVGALTVLGGDLFWLSVEGRGAQLPERTFELRMASGAGAQVEIAGGDFLRVEPSRFFLGSGPARSVTVGGVVPKRGSYGGELVVRAGLEEARLPWRVEVWKDASLRANVSRLVLRTSVDRRDVREVEFCNVGELPWLGNFSAEVPFEVVAAPRVILPGQSGVVRLALHGVSPGRVSGNLSWSAAEGRTVMLVGNVVSRPGVEVAVNAGEELGEGVFLPQGSVGTRVQVPEGGGFLLEGSQIYAIPPERFFRKVTWRQLSPTEVVLEWEPGDLKDVPFLEVRMLQLAQNEDYSVSPRWVPLDDVVVSRDEKGMFFARIDKLHPGVGFSFSVWSKGDMQSDGQPMSASVSVMTYGRIVENDNGLWLWVAFLGVGAAAMAWFHFLRKKQRASGFDF